MTENWSSCIALAACLGCQPISAQGAQAQTAAPMQLSVIVDGAATPNLIPDALAYQHFLTAIAAHPFPSTEEQARQSAQLSALGLSPADRQALIANLAPFRAQLDNIQSARAAVGSGPSAPTQLMNLRSQESTLAATTLQKIQGSLTADGMSLLDQYVRTHVKAHIKIYGGTH